MRNYVVSVATLLLFVIGCGEAVPAKAKLYPVKGKVTGSKSLADCTVNFSSSAGDGKIFGGKIGADGSYTLIDSDGREGAEPGKYKIFLSLPADARMKAMMSGGGAAGGPPAAAEAPFPPEFNDASSSTKEVEVKAESNTIDVVIP